MTTHYEIRIISSCVSWEGTRIVQARAHKNGRQLLPPPLHLSLSPPLPLSLPLPLPLSLPPPLPLSLPPPILLSFLSCETDVLTSWLLSSPSLLICFHSLLPPPTLFYRHRWPTGTRWWPTLTLLCLSFF